jgi:hypothetical protein
VTECLIESRHEFPPYIMNASSVAADKTNSFFYSAKFPRLSYTISTQHHKIYARTHSQRTLETCIKVCLGKGQRDP